MGIPREGPEGMKFISLHHHNTFSYQDAIGTPEEHAEVAASYGMTALAITDHGNTSGHVQHEKACKKFGLKALFGVEAYTALGPKEDRKFHQTILAMDQRGLSNLYAMVSESWKEYHRWPTVYGTNLAKHHEGLIVTSGCADSLLSCSLLGGKSIAPTDASWDRALDLAGRMRDLLGNRYYLECQVFPELPRSLELNAAWEKMGAELSIPLVATCDVHTLREGQHEIRATIHAAGRGGNTIAKQMEGWEYEVPDYIPRSDAEVFERACRAGLSRGAAIEACRNTAVIADRCNVTLPKAERFSYPATKEEMKWKR
jgi:DNA polymerase-3 subunit alpha